MKNGLKLVILFVVFFTLFIPIIYAGSPPSAPTSLGVLYTAIKVIRLPDQIIVFLGENDIRFIRLSEIIEETAWGENKTKFSIKTNQEKFYVECENKNIERMGRKKK